MRPCLQVSGAAPPKPCTSFAHFSFDEQLMHQIRKSEYTQPTPIQCQVGCLHCSRSAVQHCSGTKVESNLI